MKFLHIIASVDPKGGGPIEGIKQLQKALQSLDVSVEVACCDPPEADWLKDTPFAAVHAFAPKGKGLYRYAPDLVPWLRQNAKNYDAIFVEGLWQYHSFAAWRALKPLGVPYFVFTHGMLDPWFKKNYPLKHLKKWLYWPWGQYPVLRDAKAVLFTCEEERLLARTSFWLYKANEVVTSYGTAGPMEGIEKTADLFLERYPEMRGKRLLLFLSRLHEKKGCDLLIEAFASVAKENPDLRLVMAGPDQTGWGEDLKALAQRLGLQDRCLWPGMVQDEMKWGAYYASEAFCLPSHQENFGIVVAEALACGKPVLISDKVNIWREIAEDKAGFVEPDTQEGTVRLLQRWLALASQERANMSRNAQACFASRFHIRKAAERLLEIVRETR